MAPIPHDHSQFIDKTINENEYVIFSKTTCSYCSKAKDLFKSLGVKYTEVVLDKIENGEAIHDVLIEKINRTTVPQIFIRGRHIGGYMDILRAEETGLLKSLIRQHSYEYDLVVIGGGSGGLAASKQAAQMGMKVAVLDYVEPTPRGTAWGLGGTCVNVGCIPKKLMHQAAQAGETLKDSYHYGWETANGEALEINKNIKNNWMHLKEEVQNYIKSTNFQYRVQLRQEHVNYINAYGTFVDSHTIKTIDKNKKESQITADKIIIATGERPRYPDIEGAREYCITSDDIFSLPYPPGKTLVVGASYVALECAGFLHGLGFDTTVMVRSILLRGFDQEMAEKVGDYMKHEGVKFIRQCVPTKIEQIEAGEPGRLRVTALMKDGTVIADEYNTVLLAIGRDPCTDKIGLEKVGVNRNPKSGKLPTSEEQTNVPNIYAIGDVLEGKSELTPVAIQAGKLLARRLFTNSKELCDYVNIATTVFTPLEYSCVGYSEENAISKFGDEKIEVYIQCFVPVGWTLTKRPLNVCYAKLITLKGEKEKVLGFHYFGPYAGEIIQLAALALKKECTKDDLDSLIAVHPTCAEMFTMLTVTKRSGLSPAQKGCCG